MTVLIDVCRREPTEVPEIASVPRENPVGDRRRTARRAAELIDPPGRLVGCCRDFGIAIPVYVAGRPDERTQPVLRDGPPEGDPGDQQSLGGSGEKVHLVKTRVADRDVIVPVAIDIPDAGDRSSEGHSTGPPGDPHRTSLREATRRSVENLDVIDLIIAPGVPVRGSDDHVVEPVPVDVTGTGNRRTESGPITEIRAQPRGEHGSGGRAVIDVHVPSWSGDVTFELDPVKVGRRYEEVAEAVRVHVAGARDARTELGFLAREAAYLRAVGSPRRNDEAPPRSAVEKIHPAVADSRGADQDVIKPIAVDIADRGDRSPDVPIRLRSDEYAAVLGGDGDESRSDDCGRDEQDDQAGHCE